MIICSCNLITCDDIKRAVESIQAVSPGASLSAAQIYKALGKRPRCGNCLSLADEHVCALSRSGECCRQQPSARDEDEAFAEPARSGVVVPFRLPNVA